MKRESDTRNYRATPSFILFIPTILFLKTSPLSLQRQNTEKSLLPRWWQTIYWPLSFILRKVRRTDWQFCDSLLVH